MEVYKLKNMKGNWYAGAFQPTAYHTADFEIGYKLHKEGEQYEWHYHRESDEINLILSGSMILQDVKLKKHDIFVLKAYEVANPIFLEDCEIICVKTPSIPGDKYIIEEKP